MDRRDLLIGAACVAGAGAALGLIPRHHVSLLAGRRLDQIIPRTFGEWTSRDVSDLVAPKEEDSVAARIYGATVGRIYRRGEAGGEVMMLLAYGDTQSDDLQLHRPEICYPAFGFALSHNRSMELPIAAGVSVPARHLIADAPERRETILYWSRLGEYLPIDRKQQQLDRLRTAMRGDVGDGLLSRFSAAGTDAEASLGLLLAFAPDLVRAVAANARAALIGSARAEALAKANV